jgi:hypothetical protein
MSTKNKLGLALMLSACASLAQAATYNVSAVFSDGGTQGKTTFTGSFDWDGTTVSNFQGYLSESMWGWNANLNDFHSKGAAGTACMGAGMGMCAGSYDNLVSNNPGTVAGEAPLRRLTNQLVDTSSGNQQTVTTFLQNSTDVVMGGGYDVQGTSMKFGNNNAFFTLVFDKTNPSDTTLTSNLMVYGDMTPLALMGPMLTGSMGMTGLNGGGAMGGAPWSLSITAVPVPAAVWLFGSALAGMGIIGRRKDRAAA